MAQDPSAWAELDALLRESWPTANPLTRGAVIVSIREAFAGEIPNLNTFASLADRDANAIIQPNAEMQVPTDGEDSART